MEQAFSITVKKNNAPTVSKPIEDLIFTSITGSQTIDLSQYFQDVDEETLSYTVRLLSDYLVVRSTLSGSILTLKGSSYGISSMEVKAVDARGEEISQTFRLLVRDADRAYDLYPNPVQTDLHIGVGEPKSASVTLINKAGATVFSAESVSLDPFAPFKVDMSDQPAGTYYVLIGEDRYTIVKE